MDRNGRTGHWAGRGAAAPAGLRHLHDRREIRAGGLHRRAALRAGARTGGRGGGGGRGCPLASRRPGGGRALSALRLLPLLPPRPADPVPAPVREQPVAGRPGRARAHPPPVGRTGPLSPAGGVAHCNRRAGRAGRLLRPGSRGLRRDGGRRSAGGGRRADGRWDCSAQPWPAPTGLAW
jgi:hypothetical protein